MNSTEQGQYEGWRSQSNRRGTWELLSTCLVTLGLCVWTALHLNIPRKKRDGIFSTVKLLEHKSLWALAGIFVPEAMVYMAWMQWLSARALTKEVRHAFAESGVDTRYEWTDVHSFFAGMGGFVLDHSGHSSKVECPSLTPAAILRTASQEPRLLDISKASIEDRSRSDGLGKVLVCIQASYLILEVLARLVSDLPVTLLELNTLTHVICALFMYFFWFNKPLDASQTISIRAKWANSLDAIWSMRHRRFCVAHACDNRRMNIREREVFDHFRHESMRQLSKTKQSNVSPIATEDNTLSQVRIRSSNRMAGHCSSCGRLKRTSSNQVSQEQSRIIFTVTSPEDAPLLPSDGRHSLDDRSRSSSIASSSTSDVYRRGHSHPSRYHEDNNTSIVAPEGWNDPFAPVSAGLEPELEMSEHHSTKQEGIEDALATLDVVLSQPRGGDLRITRGKPRSETIKSWEHSDLVLVWHSVGDEMPDGIVRARLRQSKLWHAVSDVVLVEGYLPNAAIFRSAPDLYGLAWDEFKKLDFVNDTLLRDSICAVQLGALGLKRWEVAFEAVKGSFAMRAQQPSSLEEVVMSRMNDLSPQQTTQYSGFDTRWASQMWQPSEKSDFFDDEISDWPSIDEAKIHALLGMAVLTAMYGVLHALAWHGSFPTSGERDLWRSACLTIAIIPILAIPLALLVDWAEARSRVGGITEVLASALWYSSFLLALIAIMAYPVARVYITIESFISLRRLPVASYETPPWTSLLLHW